jgi:hypothetical protein
MSVGLAALQLPKIQGIKTNNPDVAVKKQRRLKQGRCFF